MLCIYCHFFWNW
jgi:sterol desaturase/sphingolipid hydroxylase (fatty acid hydroxylase superfamily)